MRSELPRIPYSEQRQFLKEQNEIARSQAQLTEQSLTEQSERARLTLEYDLLIRMAVREDDPQFQRTFKAAAKYMLDNAFVDDDVVAAERMNIPMSRVCNFYEDVGEMLRLGVLRETTVWNRYSADAQISWSAYEPTIEKTREEEQSPAIYENFEYLNRTMAEMDRKRGVAPFPREQLRQYMEDIATIDEEPPTTTRE